jgi:hypothetical protein
VPAQDHHVVFDKMVDKRGNSQLDDGRDNPYSNRLLLFGTGGIAVTVARVACVVHVGRCFAAGATYRVVRELTPVTRVADHREQGQQKYQRACLESCSPLPSNTIHVLLH